MTHTFKINSAIIIFICIALLQSCVSNKKLDKLIQAHETAKTNTQIRIETGKTTPEVGKEIINDLNTGENGEDEIKKIRKMNPVQRLIKGNSVRRFNISYLNLKTLNEVYSIDNFESFETVKFFKTGSYIIQEDLKDSLLADLNPLIEKILDKIKLNEKQFIEVVISIQGYSDEQGISVGSDLYNDLTNNGQIKLSQSELNSKLSKLRASSLAELIDKAVQKKKNDNPEEVQIEFKIVSFGRGTELPGNIKIGKKDDPFRRVVTIIWDVNPLKRRK
jgi:hypothetical protein